MSVSHRYHALDGLRGLAALFVVLFHVNWTSHLDGVRFVRNGYVAVDLFFILSGFVISASYGRGQIAGFADARRFMYRRVSRVYPLHVAMLLLLVLIELAKLVASRSGAAAGQPAFEGNNSTTSLVANIALVHSWGWLDHLGWNAPSWSISAEFAAYLVFAIAACAGQLRRPAVLAGIVALGAGAYSWLAYSRQTLDLTFDFGLVRCLAGFAFGVLIHEIFSERRLPDRLGWLEIPVGIATLLALALLDGGAIVILVPLFVAAVILLQRDRGPWARLLMTAPFQQLGRISYSIYMVHYPLAVILSMALKRAFGATPDGMAATPPIWGDVLVFAFIVLVILTALATFRFIEEPGRLWGRWKAP